MPRRPWDSPGKNTGVGCHFLLQCMKVKSESEVAQSCPTLSDSMDCSLPGSSVNGIFHARVLEWGAIAFSQYTALIYSFSYLEPVCCSMYTVSFKIRQYKSDVSIIVKWYVPFVFPFQSTTSKTPITQQRYFYSTHQAAGEIYTSIYWMLDALEYLEKVKPEGHQM